MFLKYMAIFFHHTTFNWSSSDLKVIELYPKFCAMLLLKKQTMQDSTPPPLSWLQENLLQELLYWKFKKDNVVLQHQLLEPIQILSKVLHMYRK